MLPARITALSLAFTLVFAHPAFALRPRAGGLEEKTAITRQLEARFSESQPATVVSSAGLETSLEKRVKILLRQIRAKPPERLQLVDDRESFRRELSVALGEPLRKEIKKWAHQHRIWNITYPLAAKLARHVDLSTWDLPLQRALVRQVMAEIRELRAEPLSLSWERIAMILPRKSVKETRALWDSLSSQLPRAHPAMIKELLLSPDPLSKAKELSVRWRPDPPLREAGPPGWKIWRRLSGT